MNAYQFTHKFKESFIDEQGFDFPCPRDGSTNRPHNTRYLEKLYLKKKATVLWNLRANVCFLHREFTEEVAIMRIVRSQKILQVSQASELFEESILLNIMFHRLMGRFQLELFIFITYFSTVVPFNVVFSFL